MLKITKAIADNGKMPIFAKNSGKELDILELLKLLKYRNLTAKL